MNLRGMVKLTEDGFWVGRRCSARENRDFEVFLTGTGLYQGQRSLKTKTDIQ